jgi:hypothetical protein
MELLAKCGGSSCEQARRHAMPSHVEIFCPYSYR